MDVPEVLHRDREWHLHWLWLFAAWLKHTLFGCWKLCVCWEGIELPELSLLFQKDGRNCTEAGCSLSKLGFLLLLRCNCSELSAAHAAACTWRWLRKCPLLGGGKLFFHMMKQLQLRWVGMTCSKVCSGVISLQHCCCLVTVSVKSLTGLCQNKTGQSELKMRNLGGSLSVSALERLFAFAR